MSTPATSTRGAVVARSFRAAREGAGLSLRALAAHTGLSHNHISMWERGQRELAEDTYQQLTDALAQFMAGKWGAAA